MQARMASAKRLVARGGAEPRTENLEPGAVGAQPRALTGTQSGRPKAVASIGRLARGPWVAFGYG